MKQNYPGEQGVSKSDGGIGALSQFGLISAISRIGTISTIIMSSTML